MQQVPASVTIWIDNDLTVWVGSVLTDDDLQVLQQKVGRNLLRYQQIEIRLKELLPFRKITASVDGLEQLRRDIVECKKKTLGQLIPGYVEGFDFASEAHKDEFKAALDQLLIHRNDLVHHLISQIGVVTSVRDLDQSLNRLDDQYRYAESVALQIRDVSRFVIASVNAFAESWVGPESGPQARFESSKRMAKSLEEIFGDGLNLELQISFFDMLREQMQLVAAAAGDEGGWVLFSRVGDRMVEIYSVRVPNLLADARQIEGYEFALRPVRAGAGSVWMYRPCSMFGTPGNESG